MEMNTIQCVSCTLQCIKGNIFSIEGCTIETERCVASIYMFPEYYFVDFEKIRLVIFVISNNIILLLLYLETTF